MTSRSSAALIAAIGVILILGLALGVQATTAEDWAQAQRGTIRVLRTEDADTGLDEWATRGYGAGIAETSTFTDYLPLVLKRVSAFRSPDGDICTINEECRSGWCTDGVCCDTSCTGTCEACKAAWNGGVDGICGFVIAGTDPDNDCPGESTCDGSGVCSAACTDDSDCASGYYCDGTYTCVPQEANGTSCSRPGQCVSGYCIDGFCCDRACTGTCEACKAAWNGGVDGVCSFVTANTDPDNECTHECDGSGNCESG